MRLTLMVRPRARESEREKDIDSIKRDSMQKRPTKIAKITKLSYTFSNKIYNFHKSFIIPMWFPVFDLLKLKSFIIEKSSLILA